jgi:uncharacterized protein (DUF488 family)
MASDAAKQPPARYPYYTIGHSTRSVETFVEALNKAAVSLVADVRTVPGSRAQPQFNAETLCRKLVRAGIQYEHFPDLGGLRKRSSDIPAHVNGFWQNQSFHNYADYALSREFRTALATLRAIGQVSICAVMCAEAVWWRCHRRIIADYLIASGETVLHILDASRIERARLTPGAEVRQFGSEVIYPLRT